MRTCNGLREEDLSAHADGELDPRAARAIEEHVARCPRCRATLAGWEEDRRALRRVFAGEPAGPGFDQGVMGALTPPEEISLRPPRWRAIGRVAAALLLLALLGGLTQIGRRGDGTEGVGDAPPPVAEDPPGESPDPLEAYARGESEDPEPCLRLLWDRAAPAADRRRAGAAIVRRIRSGAPSPAPGRDLGLRLVPLLHPELDPLAREEALRSLEALFGTDRGYPLGGELRACLDAIGRWYASLR